MTKQCTDGEWPCEMSTYVHGVDAENIFLKDFLKEILSAFDDREAYVMNGPRYVAPIIEKIKKTLEKYPDFIREREMTEEIKYPLSKIKEAFWSMFHKSGEIWFDYLSDEKSNEASTSDEWTSFLEELEK